MRLDKNTDSGTRVNDPMRRFELIFASFFGLVTIASGVAAFSLHQQRARDNVAEKDLRAIRDALYQIREPEHQLIQLQELSGELQIAGTETIKLHDDVFVSYAVDLPRFGERMIFISVRHAKGKTLFRWIDAFGSRRFQKVSL